MANGAPIGIGTGFMQGQIDQASLAESKAKVDLTQIDVQKGRMELEKMKRINDALAKLNGLHTQSGSVPAGPAQQAWEASSKLYDFADAMIGAGAPEAAKEYMKDASQIGSNAALMEERITTVEAKNAELASNLMGWVKDAKSSQEAAQRWNTSILLWQQQTGKKSPYAGVPYSPQVVDAVQAKTISAKDEADLKYKDIEAKRAQEETKLARLREGLVEQQIEQKRVQTDFLKKHGGLTASQVKAAGNQADAREAALARIDDLEQLIDQNPHVAGIRGRVEQAGEFVGSATGLWNTDMTATSFADKLAALKTALPTALGAKNTRLRIVQEHLEELSNLRGRAVSADQARTMLNDLRQVLTEGTEKKAGGKPGERVKVWESKDDVIKAYHDKELTWEQAAAALRDQFKVEE